ncbi:glycoside hydrolase 97 [Halosimplex carlsbadense 2-9-1]|uniref:Glycoside hydrolase 97 n=1 Tax=Halosimplex carlsbadense 2-9-1 TaxID=797114 RepID=M0CY14_9EURY|nr:glycoside hydrolase family 97 protein [Halosimplex carlsbadense]ELZ28121.1 glycoside hydrolase 97 [Halosimplex carlsbadense 2-9-1]
MRLTGPADANAVVFDPETAELAVERADTTLVTPSELPVGKLARQLHGVDWTGAAISVGDPTEVAEDYALPKGKARERGHRAVERTVTYDHPDADGVVEVDLRAAVEGVAVRYRITGTAMEIHTGDETTLSLPRDTVSWLTPFDKAHEASARQQPIRETDGEYCTPGLFRVDDEWLLLAEAGADGDYAAARLVAEESGMTFGLPQTQMNAHFPLETPWRVAITGDLADIVESTLVTDLVAGSDIDDDWVEPGRVAWSWWSESDSPDDFARQREYIDYAAVRGWEYVLVDAGWPRRRDEMPDLIDYAAERGVDVLLWTHWTDVNTESKREERLPTWAEWGAAGIKVDFMDADDQGRLQFYDALAEAAADHELLVNFHGSVVPTGLQRRYPHVMTYEGVMGAEYYKWSTVTPEHNCTLPFTRNVVGPMDYTPVTFSADAAQTTPGHELALSVVFESPLQHFADSIDEYGARPEAEGFLEAAPAAWDETRLVGGYPGVEATVARRDGEEWFLGAITAGPQRIVTVDCSFLGSGDADSDEEWTAHVVRDEGDGTLEAEQWTVTGDEALDVVVPENGGFAARFER